MIALALLAAAPLTCGAVPRPGIATLDAAGDWQGAAVDACRRAAARLGRPGMRFRGYRSMQALRSAGGDDIAFLSQAERGVAMPDAVIVSPAIASSIQLLVGKTATVSGERPVLCFIIGSAAEDALDTWLDAVHPDAVRLGFQEPDEMADGLSSGKCAAIAIDAADRAGRDPAVTTLATLLIDAVTPAAKASAIGTALSATPIDRPRPRS